MKLEINKLMSSRLFGELIRGEEPGFKVRLEYLNWYERLRNNFDDFLKQKLELWMFVPCKLVEDVWVVLDHPDVKEQFYRDHYDGGWWNDFVNYKKEYQEAKSKILFKGFEFFVQIENQISIVNNQLQYNLNFPASEKRVIEHITFDNLTLTPEAQKQIGLI